MKILIAHDGSESADAAVDGLALAGLPRRATVLVLAVVEARAPEEAPADPEPDEFRGALMRRLDECHALAERGAVRVRAAFPGWDVRADACADSPAVAIIRRAEGERGGVDGQGRPADLTVVGSRGFGPVKRFLMGSVAQRVLHGLRGHLRIARGRASPTGRPPRILVGVDDSRDSAAAVKAVADREWPAGTRVLVAGYAKGIAAVEHGHAASVVGAGSGGVWYGDAAGPDQWAAGGRFVDSSISRAVSDAAAVIRACCPGASVSAVVRLADPKYALLEEAADRGARHADAAAMKPPAAPPADAGADCIFVGARGARGLERFLLGSVSATVAMNAHCSVEVVHAPLDRREA